MSESRPKPARATDRAVTAAMARITMPATFQASVRYSWMNPAPDQRGGAGHRSSARQYLSRPGRARHGRNLLLANYRGRRHGGYDLDAWMPLRPAGTCRLLASLPWCIRPQAYVMRQ